MNQVNVGVVGSDAALAEEQLDAVAGGNIVLVEVAAAAIVLGLDTAVKAARTIKEAAGEALNEAARRLPRPKGM